MAIITTNDGTQIFYKDWGKGQPVVFHHGWPLTADDWDAQMLFFLHHNYRVIAHDRRGHGRSSQTWTGNDMDTYADDVALLATALDLRNAIHIGHSTGGGEVARYVARHGKDRVAKAVLIGAVPPIMVKSGKNPSGIPIEVFDGFRAQLAANRAQFYREVPIPFYGYNRPGATISQGVIDNWWRQGMMGGTKAHYDCIKAFSETDFTEDLTADRSANACHAWGRRPDRAVRGLRTLVGQVAQARHAQGLRRLSARDGNRACRTDQRRPAGLPESVTRGRGAVRRSAPRAHHSTRARLQLLRRNQ